MSTLRGTATPASVKDFKHRTMPSPDLSAALCISAQLRGAGWFMVPRAMARQRFIQGDALRAGNAPARPMRFIGDGMARCLSD